MIPKTAVKYYRLYCEGYTMGKIAEMHKVNASTVCRGIHRVTQYKCPFSSDCNTCPLPDCAIKDKYAYMVNNGIDFAAMKKEHQRNRRKRR